MDLLERDAAVATLEEALAQAGDGQGRVVLVAGEAGVGVGVGKTTLAERAARRAGSRARFLWGACDSLLTPPALGPIHDIARQAGGGLADAVRATPRAKLSSPRCSTSSRPNRRRCSSSRISIGPTRPASTRVGRGRDLLEQATTGVAELESAMSPPRRRSPPLPACTRRPAAIRECLASGLLVSRRTGQLMSEPPAR